MHQQLQEAAAAAAAAASAATAAGAGAAAAEAAAADHQADLRKALVRGEAFAHTPHSLIHSSHPHQS